MSFFSADKSHHDMRSKHFWHSVCGPRSALEELMSEAITSDCIRTYGMSQSDRNNNIVNRLGNIDKEKQQQLKRSRRRRLKSDPLLGPVYTVGELKDLTLHRPYGVKLP